jgi:hypothetical protein
MQEFVWLVIGSAVALVAAALIALRFGAITGNDAKVRHFRVPSLVGRSQVVLKLSMLSMGALNHDGAVWLSTIVTADLPSTPISACVMDSKTFDGVLSIRTLTLVAEFPLVLLVMSLVTKVFVDYEDHSMTNAAIAAFSMLLVGVVSSAASCWQMVSEHEDLVPADCDSVEGVVAMVALVVYGVVIPLALLYVLQSKHDLHGAHTVKKFGWMHSRYNSEAWWYEVALLLEKTFVAFTVSVLERLPAALLCSLATGALLYVVHNHQPLNFKEASSLLTDSEAAANPEDAQRVAAAHRR